MVDLPILFGKIATSKPTTRAEKPNLTSNLLRNSNFVTIAKSVEPDQKLQERTAAYDRLLVGHGAILDAAQDMGGGIYRISAGEVDIDSMYLLKNFPHAYMRVLLIERWFYRGALRREILTVITDEAHLHLNDLLRSVRLGSEGRRCKVAVALNKEAEVLIMLRAALQVIPPAPSE